MSDSPYSSLVNVYTRGRRPALQLRTHPQRRPKTAPASRTPLPHLDRTQLAQPRQGWMDSLQLEALTDAQGYRIRTRFPSPNPSHPANKNAANANSPNSWKNPSPSKCNKATAATNPATPRRPPTKTHPGPRRIPATFPHQPPPHPHSPAPDPSPPSPDRRSHTGTQNCRPHDRIDQPLSPRPHSAARGHALYHPAIHPQGLNHINRQPPV